MTDATIARAPVETPAKAPAGRLRLPFSKRTLLAVGGALTVAAAGSAWIALPKPTVSTDAAYVQADASTVAPKVKGLVSEVLVRHNQPVKAGAPLVRIDPEEYDARVAAAQADLEKAEAAAQSARAAFVSLDAEERLAAANIRSVETSIKAADAQSAHAEADRQRFEALAASGTAPRRMAEQYRATAITAKSDADRSRAQYEVSRDQAAVVAAKRATLSASLADAEAAVARAKAALNLARQDQAHAVVVSPIDGVVGDRQVEPGDFVQPGTKLMQIVPLNALYVTANFKETQVTRMLAGQRATIKVDAFPDAPLTGRVESFAPGSGSQFSLLPFEPGTGNFTKIVQRVPVRIRLDPGQPGLQRLRPGLSTTVKVALK
jgi:membrane fusion protein (multidrug efflux system)